MIIRGIKLAEKPLDDINAAVSVVGYIYFKKDVYISESLEETYHFEQHLKKQNHDKRELIKSILNKIDAKNMKRYKISRNEIELINKQELQKEIG